MKRFFITGTDTDCGKTFATCALLDYCQKIGIPAVAIKPVACGCFQQDGLLISEDALHLQKHGQQLALEQINPWRFALPVSPHIAAQHEQSPLSINKIADYCLQFETTASCLFIEGAGGLMVPLTQESLWTDLLQQTQIPVILVVGIRTGCINHALLTQLALKHYQIPFAGWIANRIDPTVLAYEDNINTLKNRLEAPLLGEITYQGAFTPTETVKEYLSIQEWQLTEIKKGISEADEGLLEDHESILDLWENKRVYIKA